jgi:hypothetical protein
MADPTPEQLADERTRAIVSQVIAQANQRQTTLLTGAVEAAKPTGWQIFGQSMSLPALFAQLGVVAVLVYQILVQWPAERRQFHDDLESIRQHDEQRMEADQKKMDMLEQILRSTKRIEKASPP